MHPKLGKPALRLQQVLQADGGGAEPLQHQPRRHDLLRQRCRRRARAGHAREAGEVPTNLAYAHLRNLRRATGLYSHWDDHEFVNDFTRFEHGAAVYRAGVTAFRDYAPVSTRRERLYRTFRWGKHLELFFLDERSFRSGKVRAACGSDLRDGTAAVRDAFAALVPSLANPVPQSCLNAIADPGRTVLGGRQYAAFTRAIRASTATWKVIVNEVPIQQYYALPYDRWEGYAAERAPALPAGEREERSLPDDRHARELRQRGARRHARRLRPGGDPGSGRW